MLRDKKESVRFYNSSAELNPVLMIKLKYDQQIIR